MKKKSVKNENRSLATFFVYAYIVLLVISISLGVKSFFVFRQSKFDGKSVVISVSQNKKSVAVMGINLSDSSVQEDGVKSSVVLKTKNKNISSKSVGRELGVFTDASIDSPNDLSNETIDSILTKALLKSDLIKTDLTIFDLTRLIFLSKAVAGNNQKVDQITSRTEEPEIDSKVSKLFVDRSIVSENLSIQIINATSVSGLGKRLERVILNKGGNIIAVSTQGDVRQKSVIREFKENSYTSEKLNKYLKIPIEKQEENSLADIVIIIGEDMQNTSVF